MAETVEAIDEEKTLMAERLAEVDNEAEAMYIDTRTVLLSPEFIDDVLDVSEELMESLVKNTAAAMLSVEIEVKRGGDITKIRNMKNTVVESYDQSRLLSEYIEMIEEKRAEE